MFLIPALKSRMQITVYEVSKTVQIFPEKVNKALEKNYENVSKILVMPVKEYIFSEIADHL